MENFLPEGWTFALNVQRKLKNLIFSPKNPENHLLETLNVILRALPWTSIPKAGNFLRNLSKFQKKKEFLRNKTSLTWFSGKLKCSSDFRAAKLLWNRHFLRRRFGGYGVWFFSEETSKNSTSHVKFKLKNRRNRFERKAENILDFTQSIKKVVQNFNQKTSIFWARKLQDWKRPKQSFDKRAHTPSLCPFFFEKNLELFDFSSQIYFSWDV